MDVDVFCFLEGTSSFFAGFRDQGHIFLWHGQTWVNCAHCRMVTIPLMWIHTMYCIIYIYTHPLRIPKKCGGWPYSIYIHKNHVLTIAYMISNNYLYIYNLFEEKTSGRPTKKTEQIARPGLPWPIVFWKKDSSSFWWSWWWWWLLFFVFIMISHHLLLVAVLLWCL
jgi:hypothetical protein